MGENNKNFMEALAKEIEDKNSESKDVKPKLEDIKNLMMVLLIVLKRNFY